MIKALTAQRSDQPFDVGILPRTSWCAQASMTIDAAVDGQGIALARTALVSWDLLAGRLVRPFVLALEAPYAFWIVCPKSAADLPKISTFRSWLLKEAAEDAQRIAELDSRPRARPGPRAARR